MSVMNRVPSNDLVPSINSNSHELNLQKTTESSLQTGVFSYKDVLLRNITHQSNVPERKGRKIQTFTSVGLDHDSDSSKDISREECLSSRKDIEIVNVIHQISGNDEQLVSGSISFNKVAPDSDKSFKNKACEKVVDADIVCDQSCDVIHDSDTLLSNNTPLSINNGFGSNTPIEELFGNIHLNNYSDMLSEGSSDSGKGGSDVHTPGGSLDLNIPSSFTPVMNDILYYKFELPQSHVGKLIGKYGAFVNQIRAKTGALITVKPHPSIKKMRICTVEGSHTEVDEALDMIRKKFPTYKYPKITLESIENNPSFNHIQSFFPVPVPEALHLPLPQGISCDVIVSSILHPGCLFLQQPTHPTYTSLSQLDYWMTMSYGDGSTSPAIPSPIEVGVICAALNDNGWYRAQITQQVDDDTCEIKYLDYGGYATVECSNLRQIRVDLMTLPFQAQECYLAGISPINGEWTEECNSYLESQCYGVLLQAQVFGFTEGIPLVYLYKIEGAQCKMINKELVDHGYAEWLAVEEV